MKRASHERLLRAKLEIHRTGLYWRYHHRRAEVLPVHPTKPVTQRKITVKRQDGEIVLEGEAWCYIFR